MLGDQPTLQPTATLDTSAPPINDSAREAPENYDVNNSIIEGSSPVDDSEPTTATTTEGDSEPQSAGTKEISGVKSRKRSREDRCREQNGVCG